MKCAASLARRGASEHHKIGQREVDAPGLMPPSLGSIARIGLLHLTKGMSDTRSASKQGGMNVKAVA